MKRRRRVARMFERAILGTAMSMIAFIIERRVLKAIRNKGDAVPAVVPRKGELTTTGADTDIP